MAHKAKIRVFIGGRQYEPGDIVEEAHVAALGDDVEPCEAPAAAPAGDSEPLENAETKPIKSAKKK